MLIYPIPQSQIYEFRGSEHPGCVLPYFLFDVTHFTRLDVVCVHELVGAAPEITDSYGAIFHDEYILSFYVTMGVSFGMDVVQSGGDLFEYVDELELGERVVHCFSE